MCGKTGFDLAANDTGPGSCVQRKVEDGRKTFCPSICPVIRRIIRDMFLVQMKIPTVTRLCAVLLADRVRPKSKNACDDELRFM